MGQVNECVQTLTRVGPVTLTVRLPVQLGADSAIHAYIDRGHHH